MKKENTKLLISTSLALFLGFVFGHFIVPGQAIAFKTLRVSDGHFKFIDPLIACNIESGSSNENKELKTTLLRYITEEKNDDDALRVSVYFRYASHWVGINEDDTFEPASLFKVPIMIAYLKEAESSPTLLSKKITVSGVPRPDQETFNAIVPGRSYTIEDLIRSMIVESDNSAKDILIDNQKDGSLNPVFSDLGLKDQLGSDESKGISPKDYSLFFRTLYNATFLNREMSERALSLLAETTYKDGLVAGVPKGTPVSHKFGQRPVVSKEGAEAELHDCGLVYKGKTPYFLCVMTEGKDISKLTKIIENISRLTYESVIPENS